jgi:SEC-C motif
MQGFSIATLYLLNLDGSYHQMIGENIGSLSDKVQQDHACHHWAMAFGSDFGMTLELRPDMPGEAKLENYSRLKKYQLKVSNWLYVSISADFVRSPNDTAIMFSGEWQFDAAIETVLSRFREIKLQQAVKGGRKIGRNAQCPCGSGEKFKNCCGKPS